MPKKVSNKAANHDGVEKIVHFLSSFEAVLVEVILGLLFFVYIINLQSGVSAAFGENVSLSSTWSRPRGYVFQTNTPNKTCQSDGTSCSLSAQRPGQRVDYNVTTVNGSVIYTGSVYANSSGNATATWNWDYAIAAYPTNYSNCVVAGSDCKSTNINDTTASSTTQIFSGLKANTTYRIVVCAPNCGQAGNVKLYDVNLKTGVPAQLLGENIASTCNGYRRIHGEFSWNKEIGGNSDQQYMDISFDSGFSAAKTSGTLVPYGTDPNKLVRDDLLPGTIYYWRVNSHISGTNAWDTSAYRTFGTPSCTTPSPSPALVKGAELGGVIQNCKLNGKVNLYFTWKNATGADFDSQYVDWSTNSTFPAGYGTSGALDMKQTGYGALDLPANAKIYWRVNTHIRNTYTNVPSNPQFGEYSTNCEVAQKPPTVTCQMADYNKDGLVNSADSVLTARNYGSITAANSKYDLFKDSNNVIDLKDSYIVGYLYTSNCIPRDYATRLINTDGCSAPTSGNVITLNFGWTPAQNLGVKTQRLYYDRNGHFDNNPANWPVGNIVFLDSTKVIWILNNAPQKADYYWFVETEFNDGHKVGSAIKSFKTKSCVTEPTVLSVDLEKYATECSNLPYGVNFKWTNIVPGAYLDVTTDANWGAGNFYNVSLGGGVSPLLTDGSNFGRGANSTLPLPFKFEPGKTYYWRIWYGLDKVWAYPAVKSFSVQGCVQNFYSRLDYYILMKDTSIVAADPATVNSRIANHPSIGFNLMGSSCPGYANCWDFLVGESTKAGVSPAWSLSVLLTEGKSMGFVSNSGSTPCGSDFICALPVFLRSINGQYPGFPVYNNADNYGSNYAWMRIFCGAAATDANGLCVAPYGSDFQYRVKSSYQFIAPGKLIQL